MTDEQLSVEWTYRYTERLGILCGASEPTVEQIQLAAKEADDAVKKIIKTLA